MNPTDLKTARLSLGLSQKRLAEALGVTDHTIAVWERGEQAIRHPLMLQLALLWLAHESSRSASASDRS